MRWIHATYLFLLISMIVSCRAGTTPSLDKRIRDLEAAVDSLQKENAVLRLHIAKQDSIEAKEYLELDERVVALENYADEQEWEIYDGR